MSENRVILKGILNKAVSMINGNCCFKQSADRI